MSLLPYGGRLANRIAVLGLKLKVLMYALLPCMPVTCGLKTKAMNI